MTERLDIFLFCICGRYCNYIKSSTWFNILAILKVFIKDNITISNNMKDFELTEI